MATVTNSYQDTAGDNGARATWTFSITGLNQTVGNSGIYPRTSSSSAKYVLGGQNAAQVYLSFSLKYGTSASDIKHTATGLSHGYTASTIPVWASGETKAMRRDEYGQSISASSLFDSNNPTVRTLNVYVSNLTIEGETRPYASAGPANTPWTYISRSGLNWASPIGTVTLDAPPTFDAAATSSGTYYQRKTAYSVNISNASAKYGGNIVSSSLTIGNKTVTGSGNGTLSLVSDESGTFTPVVSVTDSRGQTTTQNMSEITIVSHSLPTIRTLAVERCTSAGAADDEGTYCLVSLSYSYDSSNSNFKRPMVTRDGTDISSSVTWYATKNSSGVLSQISFPFSGNGTRTIYGVFGGSLSASSSYVVGVTVKDSFDLESSNVEQTLPQAFYTVDFKAGGHGISFGAPALSDGFNVSMDAKFNGEVYLALDTNAASGTVDAELTAALTDLGWLNDVIV